MSTRSERGGCFTCYPYFDMLKSMYSSLVKYPRLALWLLWSALFSEANLRRFAELYVNARIDEWLELGRLTIEDADELRERIHFPAVTEYIKGFMVHLGLNMLELPIVNNFIVVALAIIFNETMILLYFLMVPLLRTIYTLSRMVRNRGGGIHYGTALLAGALPKVGTIAYPLQMSTAHPNLSRFLVRSQLSGLACRVPLFGGTDSRLERFCIWAVDLMFSIQHQIVGLIGAFRSVVFVRSGEK